MFNCKLLINDATRTTLNTKTLIDHIICNKPEQILASGVIPCGISDHDVTCTIRSYKKLKNSECKPKILATRKSINFETDAFLRDLEKVPFDEIKHQLTDPNEMWMVSKTFFIDLIDKHAPLSNILIRGNTLPYLTNDIRKLIRQRDYCRAKANKTGSYILRQ